MWERKPEPACGPPNDAEYPREGTVVERARSAWEELKKGDRVTVQFSKGDPSPADRVMVTLRGGQKPRVGGTPPTTNR